MTDHRSNPGAEPSLDARSLHRIALDTQNDIQFWTRRFGVDEPQLRDLVRRYGCAPGVISECLPA